MDIDVYWPLGGGARCGCRCRCRILFVKLSSTTIPNMPCIRSHGGSSQNFFSNGNNPTDLNASIHIALTLQRLVTRPGVSQLGAPPGMAVLCQPRPLSLTPHEILDFVRPIPVVGRNDSSCSRLYHYRVRPLDRRSHQALEEKIGQWGHVPNESEELLNFLLTIARGGQPQSRIIPQGRPRPYPNSEQVRRLNDARDAPAMMMQSQAPPGTLANVPSTTPQSNPIPIKSGLPESFHYNVAPPMAQPTVSGERFDPSQFNVSTHNVAATSDPDAPTQLTDAELNLLWKEFFGTSDPSTQVEGNTGVPLVDFSAPMPVPDDFPYASNANDTSQNTPNQIEPQDEFNEWWMPSVPEGSDSNSAM